jgi:hypothetical protein
LVAPFGSVCWLLVLQDLSAELSCARVVSEITATSAGIIKAVHPPRCPRIDMSTLSAIPLGLPNFDGTAISITVVSKAACIWTGKSC